jgi:hypothetical protein
LLKPPPTASPEWAGEVLSPDDDIVLGAGRAERRITLEVGSVSVLTDSRNAARHLLAFGRLDLLPDAFVLSHRPDGVVLRG